MYMDTKYSFLCFPMQNNILQRNLKPPMSLYTSKPGQWDCAGPPLLPCGTLTSMTAPTPETSANPGSPLQTAPTAECPVHVCHRSFL